MSVNGLTGNVIIVFDTVGATGSTGGSGGGGVPYTGATANVNLGSFSLTANSLSSKVQFSEPLDLTDDPIIVTTTSASFQRVTLGGNRTLGNPSGSTVDGQRILWAIRQDGSGNHTLAFDTKYRFPTGWSWISSTGAGKIDYLGVVYSSTDDQFDVISMAGAEGQYTVSGTGGTYTGGGVPYSGATANVNLGNYSLSGYSITTNVLYQKPYALTDGANIDTPLTSGNFFRVTLGGDRTLINPSEATADGQKITWAIRQNAGSNTLGFGDKFRFPTGWSWVSSTGANKTDYLTAVYSMADDKFDVLAMVGAEGQYTASGGTVESSSTGGLVPYNGATANVDLVNYNLSAISVWMSQGLSAGWNNWASYFNGDVYLLQSSAVLSAPNIYLSPTGYFGLVSTGPNLVPVASVGWILRNADKSPASLTAGTITAGSITSGGAVSAITLSALSIRTGTYWFNDGTSMSTVPVGGTGSGVPYTGATAGLNLAAYGLTANSISANGITISAYNSYFGRGGASQGSNIIIKGGTDLTNQLQFFTQGLRKWDLGTNDAEMGGDGGANFYINASNDSGTVIFSPIQIERATGIVTIPSLSSPVTDGLASGTGLNFASIEALYNAKVPYTGATAGVNLASYSLTAFSISAGGSITASTVSAVTISGGASYFNSASGVTLSGLSMRVGTYWFNDGTSMSTAPVGGTGSGVPYVGATANVDLANYSLTAAAISAFSFSAYTIKVTGSLSGGTVSAGAARFNSVLTDLSVSSVGGLSGGNTRFARVEAQTSISAFGGLSGGDARFTQVETHNSISAFAGLSAGNARFLRVDVHNSISAFGGLSGGNTNLLRLVTQNEMISSASISAIGGVSGGNARFTQVETHNSISAFAGLSGGNARFLRIESLGSISAWSGISGGAVRFNSVQSDGSISGITVSGGASNFNSLSAVSISGLNQRLNGLWFNDGTMMNSAEFSKSLTISWPSNIENDTMFYTKSGITATEIDLVLQGSSSPSVTLALAYGTNRDSAGTTIWSGTITTVNSASSVTTFTNSAITGSSFVWLTTSATGGTVSSLHVTLNYKK